MRKYHLTSGARLLFAQFSIVFGIWLDYLLLVLILIQTRDLNHLIINLFNFLWGTSPLIYKGAFGVVDVIVFNHLLITKRQGGWEVLFLFVLIGPMLLLSWLWVLILFRKPRLYHDLLQFGILQISEISAGGRMLIFRWLNPSLRRSLFRTQLIPGNRCRFPLRFLGNRKVKIIIYSLRHLRLDALALRSDINSSSNMVVSCALNPLSLFICGFDFIVFDFIIIYLMYLNIWLVVFGLMGL